MVALMEKTNRRKMDNDAIKIGDNATDEEYLLGIRYYKSGQV